MAILRRLLEKLKPFEKTGVRYRIVEDFSPALGQFYKLVDSEGRGGKWFTGPDARQQAEAEFDRRELQWSDSSFQEQERQRWSRIDTAQRLAPALLDTGAEYGRVLASPRGPISPASLLPLPKQDLEASLLNLYRLLTTSEGRDGVWRAFPGEHGLGLISDGYRKHLRTAIVTLADFVDDADAALCQLRLALMEHAARTGDSSGLESLSTQQTARLRQIDSDIAREALRLSAALDAADAGAS